MLRRCYTKIHSRARCKLDLSCFIRTKYSGAGHCTMDVQRLGKFMSTVSDHSRYNHFMSRNAISHCHPCVTGLHSSPSLRNDKLPEPGEEFEDREAHAARSLQSQQPYVVYKGRWMIPFRVLVRLKVFQLSGIAACALPFTSFFSEVPPDCLLGLELSNSKICNSKDTYDGLMHASGKSTALFCRDSKLMEALPYTFKHCFQPSTRLCIAGWAFRPFSWNNRRYHAWLWHLSFLIKLLLKALCWRACTAWHRLQQTTFTYLCAQLLGAPGGKSLAVDLHGLCIEKTVPCKAVRRG